MIDAILIIFPSSSAIFSASDESNPFRWALRYPAAIFLVDCNLEPAIPLAPNAFAAFVPITMISTAVAPVSRPVRYGSRDGKYDGFDRQADSR